MNRDQEIEKLLAELPEGLTAGRALLRAAQAIAQMFRDAGGDQAKLERLAVLVLARELDRALVGHDPPGPNAAYRRLAKWQIERQVRHTFETYLSEP